MMRLRLGAWLAGTAMVWAACGPGQEAAAAVAAVHDRGGPERTGAFSGPAWRAAVL
jgi:hypothetical protein